MANQKTIVIIDDDSKLLEAIQTYLKIEGIEAITATNGEDGIDKIKKNHPDIVLLDIMMPTLNGKEVLRLIKADESLKDIPVIMFTALVEDLEKKELMDLGAADYLVKTDVEPDKFAAKILEVIKAHSK